MVDPEQDEATGLLGFQRTWLRGQAHGLQPVVQVGQGGLSDAVIVAVGEALRAHELVKVRLHQPEDKKSMARELAARTGAHLCGLIGHTVILYKPHPDEPVLRLPQRGK